MNGLSVEKKEFWGTTPPSLMACAGLILAAAGAWFWLRHTWGIVLGAVGLCLIGVAIRLNWKKGLDVRWRRVNFMLHIVVFILSVGILVLSWVGQTILRK